MTGDRPLRMKDIARELNVSAVTISKVLRGHPDIGEETRNRVLRRIKELGYEPNWIARSLAMRRTFIVGLVVPDLMHSFFAEIARAAANKLRSAGYDAVICNSEEDARIERGEVEHLLSRQVDGLIIASAHPPGELEMFTRIERKGTPYVLVDRRFPQVAAPYVGCDDEEIGYQATQHLIERGCRRIAHLRGPAVFTGEGRVKGYRRALEAHGILSPAEYVVQVMPTEEGGLTGMQQLLAIQPRPDGVFCYNDAVGAGAIKAILAHGLRIPEDLKLIGAGNIRYSDLLRVPLSTVDQASSEVGERAAELLLGMMASKRAAAVTTQMIVPLAIIARESTGAGTDQIPPMRERTSKSTIASSN